MQKYKVALTDAEYEDLNGRYPESDGSGLIGQRAEEIVKIHLRRQHPGCKLSRGSDGADLHVVSCDGKFWKIEVKGTQSAGVAWQQLKVSSQRSWQLITEEKIPVYRVSDVFSQKPSIYVLMHGRDFDLACEPRWTFKNIQKSQEANKFAQPSANNTTKNIGGRSSSSKYEALRNYLNNQTAYTVTLYFKDAEGILGFPLPASAYKHQAFWANQSDTKNRPWARAWQQAGYEVDSCQLSDEDGWVRFRRTVD